MKLRFEWNLSKTILGRTLRKFANKSLFARDFCCNSIFTDRKASRKFKTNKHSNYGGICGLIV